MDLNDTKDNSGEMNNIAVPIDTYKTAREKLASHQEFLIIISPCLGSQGHQQVNQVHQ